MNEEQKESIRKLSDFIGNHAVNYLQEYVDLDGLPFSVCVSIVVSSFMTSLANVLMVMSNATDEDFIIKQTMDYINQLFHSMPKMKGKVNNSNELIYKGKKINCN